MIRLALLRVVILLKLCLSNYCHLLRNDNIQHHLALLLQCWSCLMSHFRCLPTQYYLMNTATGIQYYCIAIQRLARTCDFPKVSVMLFAVAISQCCCRALQYLNMQTHLHRYRLYIYTMSSQTIVYMNLCKLNLLHHWYQPNRHLKAFAIDM